MHKTQKIRETEYEQALSGIYAELVKWQYWIKEQQESPHFLFPYRRHE